MNEKRAAEKKSSLAIKMLDKAVKEQHEADKYRKYNSGIADFHQNYADDLYKEAKALMMHEYPTVIGSGAEAVPDLTDSSLAGIRETMKDPDMINLDASNARLELLAGTNVLALGIDMAESIQAKNSLEKMLAHQLAASHAKAMMLLAKVSNARDSVDIIRLTNASARLMSTFHECVKVLHKIRNGGCQVVTVQHVNVSDGGQAVVSGSIGKERGLCREGGGNEK